MIAFRIPTLILLFCLTLAPGWAAPPKALIVVAHPDDEIYMAGLTYRLTHELGGTVDQVVITNGEGGFNYSLPAERIYGLPLTREEVGRKHLPEIRKAELLRSGKIMGVRQHHFLNQRDGAYTQDINLPMLKEWDLPLLRNRLDQLLERERYDFVFALLPVATTHGHHKAATVLALEAVARLPLGHRPVVLGALLAHKNSAEPEAYAPLPDLPGTRLQDGAPTLSFDLTTPFGHRHALNYRIISNWVIAEHKSQGTLQMLAMKGYELETFRVFHSDNPEAAALATALFQTLKGPAHGSPTPHPNSEATSAAGAPRSPLVPGPDNHRDTVTKTN